MKRFYSCSKFQFNWNESHANFVCPINPNHVIRNGTVSSTVNCDACSYFFKVENKAVAHVCITNKAIFWRNGTLGLVGFSSYRYEKLIIQDRPFVSLLNQMHYHLELAQIKDKLNSRVY